jgi:hypothetical protein
MSSTVQRLLTERQTLRIARATDDVVALLNAVEAAKRDGNRAESLVQAKAAMVLAMGKLRTELKAVARVRPGDAEDFYVYVANRMLRLLSQVHTHKPPQPGRHPDQEEVAVNG